ncbi:hypothetical protein [Opitutus sp. ER46]|uniref:hypothetical protein n=1 Tax=Opitutus sp. ER46 TaxID=2161864 RepID=UPI000D306594|nr:hypothetical protein [Opitutus sp. ER46]PTX98483.1 hypothetical protein DB354_04230 [Opitutus sp. ER46]
MTRYYRRTFAGIGLVFAALAGAAFLTNAMAADVRARHLRLRAQHEAGAVTRATQRSQVERVEASISPLRAFATRWHDSARLPEKEAAEKVRSEIEMIAQRQLGLVTDNAITPQPERYLFQGQPWRVQRVTLRASGKDLAALLTWLGKVEERYPAALVELCEFSSNIGGNTGLTLRLIQPVASHESRRTPPAPAWADVGGMSELMQSVPWTDFFPERLKHARPIGFTRNPLQPAIASDQRPLPLGGATPDEITPRLEVALEGRVRSVIRGASPLVVIDGRIFRIGDEVMAGSPRERLLPEAKTRLKHIGEDQLTFQVSGGTYENPIQCDVRYALPAFLHSR